MFDDSVHNTYLFFIHNLSKSHYHWGVLDFVIRVNLKWIFFDCDGCIADHETLNPGYLNFNCGDFKFNIGDNNIKLSYRELDSYLTRILVNYGIKVHFTRSLYQHVRGGTVRI